MRDVRSEWPVMLYFTAVLYPGVAVELQSKLNAERNECRPAWRGRIALQTRINEMRHWDNTG